MHQDTPAGSPGHQASAGGSPGRSIKSYSSQPFAASIDDEVSLLDIWNIVWAGKWTVILITAMFAFGSVIYAMSLPNLYRSQALLVPSDDTQRGGIPGQLGGLASLAGLNIGVGGNSNKVAIAVAVMTSRSFITGLIERHELLPDLMAVKSWDHVGNTIRYDPDVYDEVKKEWVRPVVPPKVPEPSDWEAYEVFTQGLVVSQDKDSSFVTVAVEHLSPHVAQRWVELLVRDVNVVMKNKDVSEAQKSIDFLQKQLAQVALADMRSVFYELIEEQTKTIMLAQVRDEYVFSAIDPPVVSESKAKPRRALICLVGTMLGGLIAMMLVLIRHFVRVNKDRAEG